MNECQHDWITIREPEGNQSGWHDEKCAKCGETRGYDTSD